MNYYDIGDLIELSGGFTSRRLTQAEQAVFDEDGTLPAGVGVNPSSVVCTVLLPDGETATPDVSSDADGIFVAEYAAEQAGPHWYAFDGTEGFQASGERRFDVRRQRVPR